MGKRGHATPSQALLAPVDKLGRQDPHNAHGLVDPLWHAVWHRRRLVVLTTFICLLAAAAYLWLATPTYTISSSLWVESSVDSAGAGRLRQPVDKPFLQTQCEVMRSPTVLAMAVNQPGIRDMRLVAHRKNVDPIEALR